LGQPSRRKRAACILYADQKMIMPSGFAWPDWAADRTVAGQVIAKAAPICTVFAEADLVSHSRQLLENRTRSLYKRLIDGNIVPAAPSNDTSHTDPSVAV
jgi:predicted ATP-grasp superfamily ATP-dependent carboligase